MGPLLLRIHPKSALLALGWFRSFRAKKSVDKNMNPIPWWTYPAIAFLQNRLTPKLKVLEFGSGASTLWLCRFVSEVISVEDNRAWAKYVQSILPRNGKLFVTDSYETFIDNYQPNTKFDIIIIDAGHRINIATKIFPMLSDDGVVLWDNTDGSDWVHIKALFTSHDFLEISFHGMTAQEISLSSTTVFYRKISIS
jgi:hypothetical protein